MATKHVTTGMVGRLRRDARGNIMYLTAGLLIPMIATIGAGVDLGQAYMAKSRLQQACDAGVLAGRKSMAEGLFDAEARTAASNMFNTNYPTGIYDSTGVSFTPAARGASEVTASATATIRTVIMKIFGKETFALTVNCTAKLEISNADIMFVLDTTGSMLQTNPGDSTNKITALRTEVMAFYDTVADAQSGDSQIRYGVVPYSSNVNVGRILFAANPSWMSTNLTIPSRTAAWVTTGTTGPSTAWTDYSGFSTWTNTGTTITGKNSTTCPATVPSPLYVDGAQTFGPSSSSSTVNAAGAPATRTITTTTDTRYNSTKYRYAWVSNVCRHQSSTGVRQKTDTATETQEMRYTYGNIAYDVTGVLNGSGLTRPNGSLGANTTAVWNGCILERDTVAFDDAAAIPAGAWDLDVDTVPNSEATRWHVSLPNFAYPRAYSPATSTSPSPATVTTNQNYPDPTPGSGPVGKDNNSGDEGNGYANANAGFLTYAACPSEAMRLTSIPVSNRTLLQNYVNGLVAVGGTYHDVGMMWGARFVSPTGLFASENTSAPNGAPISRHIIFMTDGAMAPNPGIYGFQGQEFLQGRVGSTNIAEMTARHNRRFLAACDAAKARNITVWVVSFGETLDANMSACASGDKAYQANNNAQLRTQFQAIAQQITRLRLSE